MWTPLVSVAMSVPKCGIVISDVTNLDRQKNQIPSKTGNWFLAGASAAHFSSKGILSVMRNLRTLENAAIAPFAVDFGFITAQSLHEAKMGVYTELWARFSENLRIGDCGTYVLPWGYLHPSPRPDLSATLKTREDERMGVAAFFIGYCEE